MLKFSQHLKNLKNRKAQGLLDAVMALGAIMTPLTVAALLVYSAVTKTAYNQDVYSAAFFANEGIEEVRNLIDTNVIRFADSSCWKTVTTEDVCDSAISPMIDTADGQPSFYALPPDYIDFTASLTPVSNNDFSDSAVLARISNPYSIHLTFFGPDKTLPVFTSERTGSQNTFFMRQISAELSTPDLNQDGNTDPWEETLTITSKVKWPSHTRVYAVYAYKSVVTFTNSY